MEEVASYNASILPQMCLIVEVVQDKDQRITTPMYINKHQGIFILVIQVYV